MNFILKNSPLPTVDFVDRKRKEIIEALNYNYSEGEINLLIKEKQRFKKQPTNFAFQKAEMLKAKVGKILFLTKNINFISAKNE